MNSHPRRRNRHVIELLLVLLASALDKGVLAFIIPPLVLFDDVQPRIRSGGRPVLLHQAASSFEYNAAAAAHDPSLADFSSPYFWEGFYKQQLLSTNIQNNQTTIKNDTTATTTTTRNNDFVYEWHETIPLTDLADLIPPQSRCLMVGCGNSQLPQVVLDRHNQDENYIHITLLDTSRICVEQLQVQYSHAKERVSCVCASATEMASYFLKQRPQEHDNEEVPSVSNDNDKGNYDTSPKLFDIIVDKGLCDAFMCGDGWETSVEALLRESSRILDCQRPGSACGIYLLVSYKMSPTVQATFQQLSDKVSGDSFRWDWDFDIEPLSNHRVSVSIATVRPSLP